MVPLASTVRQARGAISVQFLLKTFLINVFETMKLSHSNFSLLKADFIIEIHSSEVNTL